MRRVRLGGASYLGQLRQWIMTDLTFKSSQPGSTLCLQGCGPRSEFWAIFSLFSNYYWSARLPLAISAAWSQAPCEVPRGRHGHSGHIFECVSAQESPRPNMTQQPTLWDGSPDTAFGQCQLTGTRVALLTQLVSLKRLLQWPGWHGRKFKPQGLWLSFCLLQRW